MIKRLLLVFFIYLILSSVSFAVTAMDNYSSGYKYCSMPPYVLQNVAPNVMIMLDNSGSMFNFAYFDGFSTTSTADDNMCTNNSSPCEGFTTPGTYPSYKYYGYFSPDYWYEYATNRFVPTAPKTGSGISGARAKESTEWDGNFLNWLTMRRVDIIRKVLTGGGKTTGEGTGYDRLVGEIADDPVRGTYKKIATSDLYTPATGSRKFVFNTANSGTSSFVLRNSTDSGNEATYNVAVKATSPVEGVLQREVQARARIGLTIYNTNEGGKVIVNVAGGSLSSTVNQINLTRPSTNTPLGETLWTVGGYFAQQASILSGPGPRYASSDFTINNNADPLNYGTGGSPVYRSCGKSFVLIITDGEPCSDGNFPSTLADYASGKSNYNCNAGICPAVSPFPSSTFPSCAAGNYVAGLEDVALYLHTTDLRSSTLGVNNITNKQNLNIYTVFAFGKGSTLLRYTAINGGFEDSDGSNTPNLQSEWDTNGDNEPDNFYEATDGAELEENIKSAFLSILKRASSGTAASVLASGEGQGANLIQAVFYPRRRFGDDVLTWSGLMQNLWYYIDPLLNSSSIREDTTSDQILNIQQDYIVNLFFDSVLQKTVAKRWQDTNGDSVGEVVKPTIDFENLSYLWEAGKSLWSRDIAADPRKLLTNCSVATTKCLFDAASVNTGLMEFSTANASELRSYLQTVDYNNNGSVLDDTENIIKFINGQDIVQDINPNDFVNDYRLRTVQIGTETKVWKLGDILNSTPRIMSWTRLNDYYEKYHDETYAAFLESDIYRNRGAVFTGGNDGMLHAFKLGFLRLSGAWKDSRFKVARLDNPEGFLGGSSVALGKEMWAFIPKHAMPYLKYQTDPDYCHVYTVDLTPFLVDVSINGNPDDTRTINSWRTLLIGGMRTGGACRGTTTTCADVGGDGIKDCVNTPVDVGGESIGYSSYFAIDVTDVENPKLLWEFADPQLGFSTTGPAVVRINAKDPSTGADIKEANGHWFVVFGSGPTGPISNYQFLGSSDQNLRLFVLDLKTGALRRTIDTGAQYAFAGSMLYATADPNSNDDQADYQDEVVYFGYTKRTASSPYTWTNGGVMRLLTKKSPDPAQWVVRTLIDGIGPVTSSVVKLQDNENCTTPTNIGSVTGCEWLFFGTGRYYYDLDTAIDDQTSQRMLYGVKDPCVVSSGTALDIDPNCTATIGTLVNVTNIANVPSESTANSDTFRGWYINLDPAVSGSLGSERVVTDPLALPSGLIFFTSMQPYADVCEVGGKTYIWALNYSTGGAPKTGYLKGTALLQVSTAAVEQINLKTAFTMGGGRKTVQIEGLPPTQQGLSLLAPPKPILKILNIRER